MKESETLTYYSFHNQGYTEYFGNLNVLLTNDHFYTDFTISVMFLKSCCILG